MSEHYYTILFVENALITRTTLAALLEKPNHRVETGLSGMSYRANMAGGHFVLQSAKDTLVLAEPGSKQVE